MLLTIQEACCTLKIGRSLLYRHIKNGSITARKVGRRTLIEKAELERWVSSLPQTLEA